MSWKLLPLLSAFLLAPAALPTASACVDVAGPGDAAGAAPPCGYIQPFLDLTFPDKPKCGGTIDVSKCLQAPAMGESLTLAGTFVYYWRLSEDGTYPPDMAQPIEVTFKPTTNSPAWLKVDVEPKSIVMDPAELVSPVNMRTDDSTTPPGVLYWFERPVTVTFTRVGDPDEARLVRLDARGGIEEAVLKAKSTPNGSYFREGHGTETFRFDASPFLQQRQGPPATSSQDAPAWGLLGAVVALGLAARRARRGD